MLQLFCLFICYTSSMTLQSCVFSSILISWYWYSYTMCSLKFGTFLNSKRLYLYMLIKVVCRCCLAAPRYLTRMLVGRPTNNVRNWHFYFENAITKIRKNEYYEIVEPYDFRRNRHSLDIDTLKNFLKMCIVNSRYSLLFFL